MALLRGGLSVSEGGDATSDRAVRLGREVRRRLAELKVSGRALAEAGYIPRGNLQRLTAGRSLPRELSGLDRGLGWAPGSAQAVADGKAPVALLIPYGQSIEPGHVVIDWPRPDDDWRAAIEAAWNELSSPAGDSGTTTPDRDFETQAVTEWLAPRVQGLPVWLAERIRTVLVDAARSDRRPVDPLALADRIMALDHAHEVLELLIDWSRRPDQ